MKDFTFRFPTQVVFGRNAEQQVGEYAARHGSRAMLLYGSDRVKHSGLLPGIISELAMRGISTVLFGGIVENPTLQKAEEGCLLARSENVNLLIAVGGGSVIDTAKAISVGAHYTGALWDLYLGAGVATAAIPIGVVLTIAATASEANSVSVLHNTLTGRKLSMSNPLTYPQFALMNPELSYTVPAYQTAAGSIDIFSHAFERYFHKEQSCTLRDNLCAGVMRTVVTELPKALAHPRSYETRSQLMWTAAIAHSNMIGQEGDFACHALSHLLSTQFGLSHGAALGILMIAWCKYMMAAEEQAIAKFATQIWQVAAPLDTRCAAMAGIDRFRNFIHRVGLPTTMRQAGCNGADPVHLAAMAVGPKNSFIGGNFRKLYRKDIEDILALALAEN